MTIEEKFNSLMEDFVQPTYTSPVTEYTIQYVPVIVPMYVPGTTHPVYDLMNDPCLNCPNNPSVNPFASGFCNCILGNKVIY